MNNIQDMAMRMIMSSPQVKNNPMAKEYINVIASGDAMKGEQIANNICSSYGLRREDAIKQARQFFKM